MNTASEAETLPADVAALAAQSDLGPHTLTCLPKRLGGFVGVMLILVTIPTTWAVGSKILTAVARNTYGWELVLYAIPLAVLLYICVHLLDPRRRHARFYGFTRGFILRNSRMELTDVSWTEVVRVRKISTSQGGAPWYEFSERGGSYVEVKPSLYRRSYEVDTYMVRGARARGVKIVHR